MGDNTSNIGSLRRQNRSLDSPTLPVNALTKIEPFARTSQCLRRIGDSGQRSEVEILFPVLVQAVKVVVRGAATVEGLLRGTGEPQILRRGHVLAAHPADHVVGLRHPGPLWLGVILAGDGGGQDCYGPAVELHAPAAPQRSVEGQLDLVLAVEGNTPVCARAVPVSLRAGR